MYPNHYLLNKSIALRVRLYGLQPYADAIAEESNARADSMTDPPHCGVIRLHVELE